MVRKLGVLCLDILVGFTCDEINSRVMLSILMFFVALTFLSVEMSEIKNRVNKNKLRDDQGKNSVSG